MNWRPGLRVDGEWRSAPRTCAVMAALDAGGAQALFVGGCVRNALMGLPVADIDIATDALPETVMALAGNAGLRVVPTGIAHGTVTVLSDGAAMEVTTFRRDLHTDGRHAQVVFASDVAEDAARRDFTMNALYALPDGRVVDPLGGLPDLRARRVRFIGDASARIAEDYLRVLRYFRFVALYGDTTAGLDPQALSAIAGGLDGLGLLSPERVGMEMRKLLAAPDPAPALAGFAATGALARVIPGADPRAIAPLVHLESGRAPPDAIRRLVALGGEKVADRLRLSRAEARQFDLLHRLVGGAEGAGEIGYRHGMGAALDTVLLRAAFGGAPLDPSALARAEGGAQAVFPVKAVDLMPERQGKALGAALALLEARWIASGFKLDRLTLLEGVTRD